MKKALSITLIIVGAALLIAAVTFWIDSNTSVESESFGKALRDWVTLIAGLGASIKGWLDLLKKENSPQPTTQIVIQGGNTKIEVGNGLQPKPQTETYNKIQIKNNNSPSEEIKPVLRQFVTAALREQELKEVINDYFPTAELNIGSKSSIRELVSELINSAIQQGKVEHLIGIVRRYNSYQYNKYQEELEKIICALKTEQN
jgi:hypothetical protein